MNHTVGVNILFDKRTFAFYFNVIFKYLQKSFKPIRSLKGEVQSSLAYKMAPYK